METLARTKQTNKKTEFSSVLAYCLHWGYMGVTEYRIWPFSTLVCCILNVTQHLEVNLYILNCINNQNDMGYREPLLGATIHNPYLYSGVKLILLPLDYI